MNVQSVTALVFASFVFGGCAGSIDSPSNAEPRFGADGRADSAGEPGTNPATYLLEGLERCQQSYAEGSIEVAEGQLPEEANLQCQRDVVDAAGWTIEWRNEQLPIGFEPGSLVRGNYAVSRELWATFCDDLRAGHSSAFDSDMTDYYFHTQCVLSGERSLADVATTFAFEYFVENDPFQLDEPLPESAEAGCALVRDEELARLRADDAGADVYEAYDTYRECLKGALLATAESAEAYINAYRDAVSPAAIDQDNDYVTRTVATAELALDNNMYVCGRAIDAANYEAYETADGRTPQAACEAHLIRYMLQALENLHGDAGGSWYYEPTNG